MAHRILSVTLRRGVTYEVDYDDGTGYAGSFYVTATDELDAFTRAKEVLKEKEQNMRNIIVGITIMVLGLFGLLGYGCSQPSELEQCVAAGKTYSYTQAPSDQPNIMVCK